MRALPTMLAATALALAPTSMAWADPGANRQMAF